MSVLRSNVSLKSFPIVPASFIGSYRQIRSRQLCRSLVHFRQLPNTLGVFTSWKGTVLDKAPGSGMPAPARVEGSPRTSKKRLIFTRSGKSNEAPATDDLESQGATDSNLSSTNQSQGPASQALLTKIHGKSQPQHKGKESLSEVAQGQLCLICVAMLWGSYGPAIRYVYSLDGPPSAEVLTAVRAILQAAILLASSLLEHSGRRESKLHSSMHSVAMPGSGVEREDKSSGWRQPAYQKVRSWLGGSTNSVPLAGLELGLWNFLASSAQALGLEITSATRGSFLIQLTALLTPALAMLAGDKSAKSVWAGCMVAMVGTILFTLDSVPQVAPSANAAHIAIGGDACILAAALFYSVATVRLSRLAVNVSSLELATSKSLALAGISLCWVGVSAANQVVSHESLLSLWAGYADPAAWLVLLWSALGPGALAAYLQTRGQSKVPAAQAQIIFSSLPLWSALFATLLLQGEKMGMLGWLGGFLIVTAGIVASRK